MTMTEATEVSISPEYKEFCDRLERFRAETQLSVSSAAKLLDVTAGTMAKWFKEDPVSGKVRLPQGYVKDAITLKINRLNAANAERGVYSELRGLKPAERVNLLQSVLDSGQYS